MACPRGVQGELFVVYRCMANFDPYVEKFKMDDLWVIIPRFPTELLNFDLVANLLAANHVGALIKLDPRSFQRHKIRFA